jgi:hypothetical protein
MEVAALKRSYDRYEDLYIYYYLDSNGAGLQQLYNYINEFLNQIQESPQYTAKFLLLRRKIEAAYGNLPNTPLPLEVPKDAINSLTFDIYKDGQAVVIVNKDSRMIFDREMLRDYAITRINADESVLNPLTNQKITDIEPRLSIPTQDGGRKRGKTTKAKRVHEV